MNNLHDYYWNHIIHNNIQNRIESGHVWNFNIFPSKKCIYTTDVFMDQNDYINVTEEYQSIY